MRMNLRHTLSLSAVALVASIVAGQALAQDPDRAATSVSRDPGRDGPSAPVPDFRPYVQMPLAGLPDVPALPPGDPTADWDAQMDVLVGLLQTGVGPGAPSEPQAPSVQQPVRPSEPFIAEIMLTPPLPRPGASHDLQAADDARVDGEIMVPGVYVSEQAAIIVVPPSPVVP